MAELNQFAISRALGSKMSAGETPRFGRLGLLPLVGKIRSTAVPAVTSGHLNDRYDNEISQARDAVANSADRIPSPDRILADPKLAKRFIGKAKELGIDAPAALIKRRLLRLRKIGGILSRTTQKDPQSTIDSHNVFAIEYGIVRIAHLYGATVDDILCEQRLGNEYQKIVEALAPGYSALVYRLGALYLRKTRNLKNAKRDLIGDLDPAEIERSWIDLGTVKQVHDSTLTGLGPGILHLDEDNRSLYVCKTHSVSELASTFLGPQVWNAIGNHFWQPDMNRIHMKVLPESGLGSLVASWELRLIQSWEPVFNMKVGKDAA